MVRPTIGRSVHYVAFAAGAGVAVEHRAAIVTEEPGDGAETAINAVGLAVFNPEGLWFKRTVPQDQKDKAPGTWHWPEGTREEEKETLGLS